MPRISGSPPKFTVPATDPSKIQVVSPKVEGSMLTAYGHSYLDPTMRLNGIGPAQRYVDRIASRLNLVLDNNAISGYHMEDCVLDAMGSRDATKKWAPGETGVVVIDAITNDAGSPGNTTPGLLAWETGFRGLCWYLSSDPAYIFDDQWAGFTYTGTWTNLPNGDYSGGTLKQLSVTDSGSFSTTMTLAGKWGLAFASLAQAREIEVLLDGVVVKTALVTGATTCGHTGAGGTGRAYSSCVVTFDVTAGSHTLVVRNKVGGVATTGLLFDYMSKSNTVNPPQIFVPTAVYTRNGTADATYDAYNARQALVAAEFPNVHIVDVLTGWNKATMIGTDTIHPSALGHEFIAERMTKAIVDWYAAQ